MLTPKLTKVEMSENSAGAVSVFEYLPQGPKENAFGELICVVSTKKHTEGVSPAVASREIFERLKNKFYSSDVSAFNALKNAVGTIVQELSLTWGEIDLVVVNFTGEVLYAVVYGFSQVAIVRGGMFAPILAGKGELVSASGYPKFGDFLILGTRDFFESVPQAELKKILIENQEVQPGLFHRFVNPGMPLFGVGVVSFDERVREHFVSFGTGNFKSKPKLALTGIFEKISVFTGKFKPSRGIYIKSGGFGEYESKNKRVTLTVGIILITLLLISIVFGVRQRNTRLKKEQYEPRLTQAIHEFEEAISLYSINPERSRELFLSSREIANQLSGEGIKDEALVELLPKIKEQEGSILGEYMAEPENFIDLSLLSSGFSGTDLASSGEEIFVLDKNNKKIAQVNLVSKRSQVVAGEGDYQDASQVIAYEDRVFVDDNGVLELGGGRRIDKDWEGDVLFYSYAGNIYVLEKASPNIWRFSGVSGGFSSRQSWLGSGLTLDFSDAKSIVIDGSVWVLGDSDIQKFTFGTIDTFRIAGLPGSLGGAVNIYTNEDSQYLYVLDPGEKRIIVLDKEGKFKAQYISQDFSRAQDLVVSEEERRVIILIDGNLSSIELRHL